MQKLTITAPDSIHFSIIADALAQLDAGITVKPCAKRATSRQAASDSAPEYVGQSDLEYRRYCSESDDGAVYDAQSEKWYLPEVMDGVSVDKAIRKIMAEVRKGQNSDGRSKAAYSDYPALVRNLERRGVDCVQEYITRFCDTLHHVKAEYTNGVTA